MLSNSIEDKSDFPIPRGVLRLASSHIIWRVEEMSAHGIVSRFRLTNLLFFAQSKYLNTERDDLYQSIEEQRLL